MILRKILKIPHLCTILESDRNSNSIYSLYRCRHVLSSSQSQSQHHPGVVCQQRQLSRTAVSLGSTAANNAGSSSSWSDGTMGEVFAEDPQLSRSIETYSRCVPIKLDDYDLNFCHTRFVIHGQGQERRQHSNICRAI